MALPENAMSVNDILTPDDHEIILRHSHNLSGTGDTAIIQYALARSAPAHRGTRLQPPLKPTRDSVDLSDDAALLAEIMR
jgi:hypothetical protein